MYRQKQPATAGAAAQPVRVDFANGVTLHLRPIEPTPMLLAGRRAAREATLKSGDQSDFEFSLVAGCVVWGALSWEGIGAEPAEGEEPSDELLPLTPETLTQFLRDEPDAYDQIDTAYVLPALMREMEKNASSPSLTGTSAAATTTAPPAKANATSAPIESTPRNRTKASKSGASSKPATVN